MPFKVDILTPQERIFEGTAFSLVVPAALGYLGVLANHAPLIANLSPGKITYQEKQGRQSVIYNKGKGFIEVLNNKATILLEVVEKL